MATASGLLLMKTAFQQSASHQHGVKVIFSNLPLRYVLDISANIHMFFEQASVGYRGYLWVADVFLSCSWLSVVNNSKKKNPPPNQIFYMLKSQRCRYLHNGNNTCSWQQNNHFKRKEDGVQTGRGSAVGGGKDSRIFSHLTFPVLSHTAFAGAWKCMVIGLRQTLDKLFINCSCTRHFQGPVRIASIKGQLHVTSKALQMFL